MTSISTGSAALAERKRLEAILTGPAARGRTTFAHYLAFQTNLEAGEALALLAVTPKEAAAPASRSRSNAAVGQMSQSERAKQLEAAVEDCNRRWNPASGRFN
ncbi:hypothetical protein [Methylocella sp.]|uniref:hypothetical protein n=1 Tax=Methylocella sp. TaxID=1978226 RepID=UPI0035B33207